MKSEQLVAYAQKIIERLQGTEDNGARSEGIITGGFLQTGELFKTYDINSSFYKRFCELDELGWALQYKKDLMIGILESFIEHLQHAPKNTVNKSDTLIPRRKNEIIQELLDGLKILQRFHQPPEETLELFVYWLENVPQSFENASMFYELDIWNRSLPKIKFSFDESLVIMMSAAKTALLGILKQVEDKDDKVLVRMEASQLFDDIRLAIKGSKIEASFISAIVYDLDQAETSYNSGANKACVIMLGAGLEGIMLGVLRSPEVIQYLQRIPTPPVSISRLGLQNPQLAKLIAERLSFEDYKNSLHLLITDIDQLGIDNIQKFRNAVHPWNAIQEPNIYGNYDQARAIHHLSSMKILVHLLLSWTP